MHTYFRPPIALLLALGAALGAAASDRNLEVTGSIVPGACDISLDSTSNLDFGDIPTIPSGNGRVRFFGSKDVGFGIECSSASLVEIHFHDEGPGSKPVTQPKSYFNLIAGEDEDVAGKVEVRLINGLADGEQVDFRVNGTPTTFYNLAVADDPYRAMLVGWDAAPYRTVTGTLRVWVIGDTLDPSELGDVINLRSRIGVELMYL